jgi:hypothetical protein
MQTLRGHAVLYAHPLSRLPAPTERLSALCSPAKRTFSPTRRSPGRRISMHPDAAILTSWPRRELFSSTHRSGLRVQRE